MNKEKLIENIFNNKSLAWLNEINEEMDCIKIQQIMILNENISYRIRWLDKFVLICNTKQYLSLLWSCIPKDLNYKNTNFNLQKNKEDNEFNFIFTKIKKYYNFSDYEFSYHKKRLSKEITKNTDEWFRFFAIEKRYWDYYRLDYKKYSRGI